MSRRWKCVPPPYHCQPAKFASGIADWFVFVPWFLVLASSWIYLAGPDRAPWTEAMHEFYGMRHTAEVHIPWVIFGSLLIFLYSFTLFLGGRLLFRAGCKILDDRGRDFVHSPGSLHRLGGVCQLRQCIHVSRAVASGTYTNKQSYGTPRRIVVSCCVGGAICLSAL